MSLMLGDLDARTRRFMLAELEHDVARGLLYISPQLSERGRGDYERLLRDALRDGTEDSLAEALGAAERMAPVQQWGRIGGRAPSAELTLEASRLLAQGEFHRFYARGLCRRAAAEGIRTLAIYRAGAPPTSSRAHSGTMIGVRIDAGSLLEDLRTGPGATPPRGLPQCADAGLSVRLP